MCVEALKILKEGGLSKIYFTGDGLIANRKLIRSIIGDEYYREGTAVNLLGRAPLRPYSQSSAIRIPPTAPSLRLKMPRYII